MKRIKSDLFNDVITILEEGDSAFFSKDKVNFELTEIDEIFNKIEIIPYNQYKNIYNLKKIFDGQIINKVNCQFCNKLVQKEKAEDENGNNLLLNFELYTEEVHKCS